LIVLQSAYNEYFPAEFRSVAVLSTNNYLPEFQVTKNDPNKTDTMNYMNVSTNTIALEYKLGISDTQTILTTECNAWKCITILEVC